MTRRQRPPDPSADDFPELDVTNQAQGPPTRRGLETKVQPTVLLPSAGGRAAAGGRDLLRVAGGLLALAMAAGVVLLARRPPASAPASAAPPPAAVRQAPAVQPTVQPAPAGAPADATPPAEEPAGPQGRVAVVSSYPVDVVWNGMLIARSASQLSLPVGRQVITLVAASYFVRSTVAVNVKPEGVAGVEAPRLGKINIKANPDNCEVFIDGAFVDYPPILDKAVAVGAHTVAFKWPDGTRREEQAEVEAGSPSYVMGRKD